MQRCSKSCDAVRRVPEFAVIGTVGIQLRRPIYPWSPTFQTVLTKRSPDSIGEPCSSLIIAHTSISSPTLLAREQEPPGSPSNQSMAKTQTTSCVRLTIDGEDT
ncbi:hypothetical protein VTO42DRAFT_2690 [Malbranchea cinnamomea]